jgi:hypothetical protein
MSLSSDPNGDSTLAPSLPYESIYENGDIRYGKTPERNSFLRSLVSESDIPLYASD